MVLARWDTGWEPVLAPGWDGLIKSVLDGGSYFLFLRHSDGLTAQSFRNLTEIYAVVQYGLGISLTNRINRELEQQEHPAWMQHIADLQEKFPLNYDPAALSCPYIIEEVDRITGGDAVICMIGIL